MTHRISRREFITGTIASAMAAANARAQDPTPELRRGPIATGSRTGVAKWLDERGPKVADGATWGMPWPRGKYSAKTRFTFIDDSNTASPMQTWPIAYWPDGSLKWTAHAIPAGHALGNGPFQIVAKRTSPAPSSALRVSEDVDTITVDTGVITARIPRSGKHVISSISRDGREALRDGKLVLLLQDRPALDATGTVSQEAFESTIDRVTLEQRGPVRALVKVEGRHRNGGGRAWLPFTLRLYFYSGGDAVRVLHTIVFDGDESRDFIRGIGLRFATVFQDELYDRHIRFAGESDGLFGESVRGLTGLRRNPGTEARNAQIEGKAVPSIAPFTAERLHWIPTFGDWTLLQPNADSFVIRKRTAEGHAWLDADRGRRASGLGYLGGPSGGIAFGIRNFWQSHPAQLDIRHATQDIAEVTLWVWAPDATPMDLRFYHDGLGQDTFEEQLDALNITYEDYEPGFGTPMGVARTSEMTLRALAATPTRERLTELAAELREPATMVASPETLAAAGVFAKSFSLPGNASPKEREIDERLAWLFDFYRQQQDERSWYGFWNYGDVMHTYDADRHTWRYDIGGYAWDNSELSTDIWLWLYFMRSGRGDVFRFAEAMTRHTGEVDVHHLGRFAPLGSRHNVMHWGCSAKQLRISTALNRRYYYFLTADERVGDLMREQVEGARALLTIQPERKLPQRRGRTPPDPNGEHAYFNFGTDWGSIAGAWLTEWERTGDKKMRARLLGSMRTIASQPKRFFTGSARMNVETGEFEISRNPRVEVSHLSAAFGLPEVCAELIELLPVPEFERAWIEYCELYNASAEEQKRALGESLGELNLQQGHSRLTAYAAYRKQDAALAKRAWQEFDAGRAGYPWTQEFESQRVSGPAVLNPVTEAAWVSTNSTAQWGLAAIECLAWLGPRTLVRGRVDV